MTLTPGTYIIAFDPGETSGVAVGEYVFHRSFEILLVEEVKWADRFNRIEEIILTYQQRADHRGVPLIVVCEQWKIFPNMIQALAYSKCEAAMVEGVIEKILHDHGLDPLIYQQPKDRLACDVLNADFHWVRGSDHKTDAYQHLRLYVLRNRILGPIK